MRQIRRYPAVDLGRYRRFMVAGRHMGWVVPDFARALAAYPQVFHLTDRDVNLHERFVSVEDRSRAVADVLDAMRAEGKVPGWRNELYPVRRRFTDAPLLLMERAATHLFGVPSYGINVNGLVRNGDGWKVWVARRSATKQVDPNMLDLIVGGGLPYGISVHDNLLKECMEEAGIPKSIAQRARPTSLLTLMIEAPEGLRVGVQFNFDLELPADFAPRNEDGEVAGFQLWTLDELERNLRSADDFMYDVALANLDLLIRLGRVGPDDPDYLDLIAHLRRPIPLVRS
jgi:8-oxo-dGTP pyrophosphatase MutT (NUDIX family)